MIKKLHPTLKACKCGFIGTRTALYKHLDQVKGHYELAKMSDIDFWKDHGETPLNEDDPRLDTTTQLEYSLSRQEKLQTI